jgi:hypothetical protein
MVKREIQMSSYTDCKTVEEFYAWAAKHVESAHTWKFSRRSADDIILNPLTGGPIVETYTDYSGETRTKAAEYRYTRYELEATGYSGTWGRGIACLLPWEIGDVLAASWKRNGPYTWSSFVGVRKLESILNIFDKTAGAAAKATAKAARAANDAIKAKNARNYARRDVAEAAKKFAEAMRRSGTEAGFTDFEDTALTADTMAATLTAAIEA